MFSRKLFFAKLYIFNAKSLVLKILFGTKRTLCFKRAWQGYFSGVGRNVENILKFLKY